MGYIKNYESLATSEDRKVILQLIEAAYASIDATRVLEKYFKFSGNELTVGDEKIDLSKFENIFLLGFGKGSAKISSIIEKKLGKNLTKGFVIDIISEKFLKIEFTKGTHPLPSQVNFDFTKKVLEEYKNFSASDLVIVITCGGGSAMLVHPQNISVDKLIETNKALLKSGATIAEMNIVRKHLSRVKGGGLGKSLYPATIFNLIFSDVPGNDFSVIASGPTVLDNSTTEDALNILEKYKLTEKISVTSDNLAETPKDSKLFDKVKNILMLSNKTALDAMESKAKELRKNVKIFSDTFQSEAKTAGEKLIGECAKNSILLVGGETTVKVTGKGQGGRNQEVVLGALTNLNDETLITSFASDGWDNIESAGAIGDSYTIKKAEQAGINPNNYLIDNDSLAFFKTVGDAILTGRLPTNVSDLMIVLKK